MNLMSTMPNYFKSRRETDIQVLARYLGILPTAKAKKAALLKLLSNLDESNFEHVELTFEDYAVTLFLMQTRPSGFGEESQTPSST